MSDAPIGAYDIVFAIDSLEHNDNFGELLGELTERLAPNGIFVLSGPSENYLYRLGRRVAGFEGHYHHTTIYDIEREARRKLRMIASRTVPFGIPLFRISAWKHA